jgi:hypothetical protein
MARYFYGEGSDLGTCKATTARNFRELVERYLSVPVLINRTHDDFLSLTKRERDQLKKTNYLVPCVFDASPSPRQHQHATHCNLLCLDVDDSDEAKSLLQNTGHIEQALLPWSFAVYTTASHTSQAPRLRIMVDAEAIPPQRYPDALATLADRLGVTANKESKVAVQPMYLPICFLDQDVENDHPLILDNREGATFQEHNITVTASGSHPSSRAGREATLDDLDFLRPPVEEVTLDVAAEALESIDPDCGYQTWLEVAAALKHQFPGRHEAEALDLFDAWSSKGNKYEGRESSEAKWRSLKSSPLGRAPVTIRSLLHHATVAGWSNAQLKDASFAKTRDWFETAQSFSELSTTGVKMIAGTLMIGQSEEDALIQRLVTAAKNKFGERLTPTAVRKDVAKHKAKIQRSKDEASKKLPPWVKGLVFIASVNKIMRHSTGEVYDMDAFNNMYSRKLLPDPDTVENPKDANKPTTLPTHYVMNEAKIPTVYATDYNPAQPNEIFFTEDNRVYLNTYVRSHPAPKADETGEVAKVFLNHMENLIAEPEYRRTVIDFLAFLVQNPGRKVRWAVLLQGAQGCGKTALAELMRAVLGNAHVKTVDCNALNSQWNDWSVGHQLVTLEEIRVAGTNRHEVMNVLKPLISNARISVNQRFMDNREMPNRTNYLLFTNHHDSLAITDDDRRYFVLKSRLQTREQVVALGRGYFEKLFEVINDRAAEMRHFFENWQISDDFPADSHAPVTTYLSDLVETSVNDTHQIVRQIIKDGENPLVRPDLVSIQKLRECVLLSGGKDASMQYLGNLLREEGYQKDKRIMLDGDRHNMWTHVTRWDKHKGVSRTAEARLQGKPEDDEEEIVDLL